MKESLDITPILNTINNYTFDPELSRRKTNQFRRIERDFALNPSLFEQFEPGKHVLIIPFDDPKIAEANLKIGKMLIDRGENIGFYCPIPQVIKLDA